MGNGAQAIGDGTANTAIGANASANLANSAAWGAGATATRANQQVFGTAANTYTMAGIASAASKTAQGAPTSLVTSNASGDLAAYTPSELGLATSSDVAGLQSDINRLGSDVAGLQSDINRLGRRDQQLTEGIATVASLAQPILLPGQHFAMRAGWGGFDDANAVGFSAAGVLANNLLRPGFGSLVLDGGVGVGTNQGEVAGRAGMSFGW
jgi:hypothetical protein